MKIINPKRTLSFSISGSNLFLSRRWLQVISKSYGITFQAVIDEEETFFLPFCLIKDYFFTAVKSVPFSDYSLNSFNENKLNSTLKLLQNTYPKYYIKTSVVQKTKPNINRFFTNKSGYLNQININDWREGKYHNLAHERNIRKALNYGLSVKVRNDLDSLNNFYKLHEQLRIHKFHKLPQPINFFTNLYQEFIASKKGFFLEAWNKEILIASWVILKFERTLYYKFGASDRNFLHFRPNDLLFRFLVDYGSSEDYHTIDLGFTGTTKNYEGLIRFKSKEGGNKIPIYRIEYFPDHFIPKKLHEKNHSLKTLTQNAIDSNDLNLIRQTSNENYYRFA